VVSKKALNYPLNSINYFLKAVEVHILEEVFMKVLMNSSSYERNLEFLLIQIAV